MGLDARVYCDCFEKGRLKSEPPPGCRLTVDERGELHCGSDDMEAQVAFEIWRFDEACGHRGGLLVEHFLGNPAVVAGVRAELLKSPDRFPLLLRRVLREGTRAGGCIPVAEVPQLREEVAALAGLGCADPDAAARVAKFAAQMRELAEASLAVNKPIVFSG